MTIDFYDGVNEDALFNALGKLFAIQEAVNTARYTTIPTVVHAAQDILDNLSNSLEFSESLESDLENWQRATDSLQWAVRAVAESVLVEFVHADAVLDTKSVSAALAELIEQMDDNSESVDQSTAACSVAAVGSPNGNGRIAVSVKDGEGRLRENMLAETITAICTVDGPNGTIQFTGDPAADPLSEDYAQSDTGSGITQSVTTVEASNSLLANGDMEDEDDYDDLPDDWLVTVGTAGTTIKMTNVEVQTVTISSSPSAGHYLLHWVNADSEQQTTAPIAYNATGNSVQAALRKLEGLGSVTVSTAGTTPNYTHTVTFEGIGGNVAQLTSTDNTTGGSIAHATTSAGTSQVFAGSRAVEIDSDGATLVTFNQKLSDLEAETPYAVNLWAMCDVVPAAGVITVDLVDGTGGTVIQDTQSNNNAMTFNCADLANASWKHLGTLVGGETVFRLPAVVPDIVYLRIRVSTAISAGTSVFVDHAAMSKMTELYAGGPYVCCFSGGDRFRIDDEWLLTATNDRAGEVQDYMNRNFALDSLGLLLPSATGAGETIPDTVI
jgi:hypothetical protein